jgi:hypothetical protein
MSNTQIPHQTKALINIGVLTPKRKRPVITQDLKHRVALSVQANFTNGEIESNPELKQSLLKITDFFRATEMLSEDTDFKFVRRQWIIQTLSKEIDSVREAMAWKNKV